MSPKGDVEDQIKAASEASPGGYVGCWHMVAEPTEAEPHPIPARCGEPLARSWMH